MKSKVLLISLVFVALALSVSAVSALSFERTGSTTHNTIEGDKGVQIDKTGSKTCVIKKNGDYLCRGKDRPKGGLDNLKKVSLNEGHFGFLSRNGECSVDDGTGSTFFIDCRFPASNQPYSQNDLKKVSDISFNWYETDPPNWGGKPSLQNSRCGINISKDFVSCSGSSDAYGSLHGYSASGLTTTLEDISVGRKVSCVLEQSQTFTGTPPTMKNLGDVYCYGSEACDPPASQPNCVGNYTKGDASQVSAGGNFACILKDNSNVVCLGDKSNPEVWDYSGNDAKKVVTGKSSTCIIKDNGNVECKGLSTKSNYNKGDAIDVTISDYYGNDAICILKESGDYRCWGQNNGYGQLNNYTYDRAPDYSSFSISNKTESNGKIKVESSIIWNDPENNFDKSYFEHNMTASGNPTNVTSSKTSHKFSKNVGVGSYYVRFYGKDKAGNINSTGKKFFQISKSPNTFGGSFHWEDASGNKIPSISITDSKNVTMVANYSSQGSAGSNTLRFEVFGDGNSLTNKSGVNVKSIGGSDYAEKEVNITSSWASSYKDLHFNVTGNKSSDLGLNCKNCGSGGGQTCPVGKTNISCVSPKKCDGNTLSQSCNSGVCCDNSTSGGQKPLCEQKSDQYNFCNDYKTKPACESNSCDLGPINNSGCDGNCGCWWNATGSGPSQGSCLGFVNGSETKGMPDDGLCLQVSNSSDTCGDDGVLETSWDVKWRNTSSGETYTKQSKIPASCQPGSKTTTCPSVAKLPAENNWTIPLTVFVLVGVYAFFYARRN